MAQFRATVQGKRGEVSRLGSKSSGMAVKVNGWDSGINVVAGNLDGADCFDVFQTGGSNNPTKSRFIGRLVNGQFFSYVTQTVEQAVNA